jgi:hypothetical protein
VRYINKVQINPASESSAKFAFLRIESMEPQCAVTGESVKGGNPEPRRLLVLGKQANQMFLIEFPESTSSEEDMMEAPE